MDSNKFDEDYPLYLIFSDKSDEEKMKELDQFRCLYHYVKIILLEPILLEAAALLSDDLIKYVIRKSVLVENTLPLIALTMDDELIKYTASLKEIWRSCLYTSIPMLEFAKSYNLKFDEFELVENVIDNLECLKYICDEFNIKICKNNLQKIKTDEIFTHAINYTEASTLYLINLAAKKGFINSVIILRLKLN